MTTHNLIQITAKHLSSDEVHQLFRKVEVEGNGLCSINTMHKLGEYLGHNMTREIVYPKIIKIMQSDCKVTRDFGKTKEFKRRSEHTFNLNSPEDKTYIAKENWGGSLIFLLYAKLLKINITVLKWEEEKKAFFVSRLNAKDTDNRTEVFIHFKNDHFSPLLPFDDKIKIVTVRKH
jgi:hypothetical protein